MEYYLFTVYFVHILMSLLLPLYARQQILLLHPQQNFVITTIKSFFLFQILFMSLVLHSYY